LESLHPNACESRVNASSRRRFSCDHEIPRLARKVRSLLAVPGCRRFVVDSSAPTDSASWRDRTRRAGMLWTIFVILLVMWLLGMVSSYTLGGYIHLLLVLAVVVALIRLLQGRRPL
jgi:Flp pilus assembly protein TadB